MISSFGERFRISIFGESHGPSVGVTIEGFPAGEAIDQAALQAFLARRAPGGSAFVSQRKERDLAAFESGVENGFSTGYPIRILFQNEDVRSTDYSDIADIPRPGHADYTARIRYGNAADIHGGGHFSGRLTAPLCAAGGIALQYLSRRGVTIGGHILQIGPVRDRTFDPVSVRPDDLLALQSSSFPVLDETAAEQMQKIVLQARDAQDSVGGMIECAVLGLPAGLGDPMFNGIENRISRIVFGIPAVKAVAFGEGEAFASMAGSEANDPFVLRGGRIATETNHCGGILGGLSTGMPVVFTATFKPTPSIGRPQKSVDLKTMREVTLTVSGRHDPCIAVRAVPCVEAAAACAVIDMYL